MATLKVKKLSSKAVLPKYQSRGAAGFDLCSTEELVIPVGRWALIATGLAFGIKRGYEIQIRPRSGLALKYGFTILNRKGGEEGIALETCEDLSAFVSFFIQ